MMSAMSIILTLLLTSRPNSKSGVCSNETDGSAILPHWTNVRKRKNFDGSEKLMARQFCSCPASTILFQAKNVDSCLALFDFEPLQKGLESRKMKIATFMRLFLVVGGCVSPA
jgi:hypothetical protein